MIPTSDLRGRKRESSTEYEHSNLLGRRNGCAILRDSFSARSRPSCGFSMRPGDEESETRPRTGRKESRGQKERERETERRGEEGKGDRERRRETHVRATTMYFGAALHTPRRGQCPSLLRPKEGAEGREGWREQEGERSTVGREREREERGEQGRQGGGHTSAEWRKNEQTPRARERQGGDRATEKRPGARSPFPLPPAFRHSPLFFSLLCDCHSFSTIPRLRFTMHRRLHRRRASYSPSDFLNVKTRSPTDREGSLSFPSSSCLSASFFFSYFFSIYLGLRLVSRTRTCTIKALWDRYINSDTLVLPHLDIRTYALRVSRLPCIYFYFLLCKLLICCQSRDFVIHFENHRHVSQDRRGISYVTLLHIRQNGSRFVFEGPPLCAKIPIFTFHQFLLLTRAREMHI